jgi:hypothetical protein
VGRHRFHEEAGSAARSSCGAGIPGHFAGAAAGEEAVVERSLFGGREACASKSFPPRDGSGEPPADGRNGERDFRREKRSNETHQSTTDPDARLLSQEQRPGEPAVLHGHVLMENRNGLAIIGDITQATGTAERMTALDLIDRIGTAPGGSRWGRTRASTQSHAAHRHRRSCGQDWKAAQVCNRRTHAAPRRLCHQPMLPQTHRGIVRLAKTVAGLAQVKVRGLEKVQAVFIFAIAAYNLVRIPKLLEAT